MKSTELIKIFDVGTKILAHYKNKDVLFALNDILNVLEERTVSQETVSVKKKEIKDSNDINPSYDYRNMTNNLTELALEEVKPLLEDNKKFPNIESLKVFASELGIKIQARASRVNIIHSIIKSVERSRIDQMISSRVDK
jgi:virulence-associated protein VapD